MKSCPQCQTLYTDDTLRFCLQDGAELIHAPQSVTPTVAFSDPGLAAGADSRGEAVSQETQWRKSEVTRIGKGRGEKKSSTAAFVAAAVIIGLFLIAGGTGLGLWLYLRDWQDGGKGNNSVTTTSPTPAASPTPTPTPTVTQPPPTPTPTASTTPIITLPTPTQTPTPPAPNDTFIRREVEQTIFAWKSDIESMNINRLMSRYAGTVDYYLRKNADRNFVRNDKMRAFRLYDSIQIRITNLSISVDGTGETATAAFDKAWVFEGARRSSGMVRSQLKLRNFGGVWLISSERDLRVYRRN